MTTELLELAPPAPTMQFTPLEFEAITQKLDAAIQLKQEFDELRFPPPKSIDDANPVDSNPVDDNSLAIDISRFGSLGLQGPDDLRQFLLTNAGETVIHEIATEVTLERAQEEERQFEIQRQIMEEERIKALLLHWLLDDEEDAKKIQQELIAEQQEKVLNKEEQHSPEDTSKPKKDGDSILKAYTDSIDKSQKEQRVLSERIEQLEQKRLLLDEKYETYEQSFSEFDNDAHEFESGNKDIDEEITKLKAEADEIASTMSVTGNEKEMQRLGNKLNTIGFKIANLENIRSASKGEKRFADAEGNFEDEHGKPVTFKDAAFVLSLDQEIKKDEKTGNYCLLEKGQTLEKMTDKEKELAQDNYKHSKKDLQLVKHAVKDVKKEDLYSNTMQLAQHKAEHRMLQNHIHLMHAARTNAQKALNPQHGLNSQHALNPQQSLQKSPRLDAPQSSRTPKGILSISTDAPKPAKTPKAKPVHEVLGDYVKTVPSKSRTWQMLFKFVEEIPNPKAQNEANEVLIDAGKKELSKNPGYAKQKEKLEDILKNPEKFKVWLKKTLSAAPVPDATMQDLLKNMASNTQNPYDPDVTTIKSPLELQQEPKQEQRNAPMNK